MIRSALALAVGLAATDAKPQVDVLSGEGAVLRGLDKVSGQTVDIEVKRGVQAAVFGLQVDVMDCRYPIENPTGDAYAFLVIREEGARDPRFEGWMIASSPALSALDHRRYDVWLLRCITS